MSNNITFHIAVGHEIKPYIEDMAKLRIQIFREFPYLYDGHTAYETNYLNTYCQSERSVAVFAMDSNADNKIIGVATGIPMADEEPSFQQPFQSQGYDPSNIFYFGESVLLPAYRGKGIGVTFLAKREQYARELGTFFWACFCAVERSVDHPLRPKDYVPLDRFWQKRGFEKHPTLQTTYTWKQIDETAESPKTMTFWLKQLK